MDIILDLSRFVDRDFVLPGLVDRLTLQMRSYWDERTTHTQLLKLWNLDVHQIRVNDWLECLINFSDHRVLRFSHTVIENPLGPSVCHDIVFFSLTFPVQENKEINVISNVPFDLYRVDVFLSLFQYPMYFCAMATNGSWEDFWVATSFGQSTSPSLLLKNKFNFTTLNHLSGSYDIRYWQMICLRGVRVLSLIY